MCFWLVREVRTTLCVQRLNQGVEVTKSRHILIRDHNQPRIWLQMELNNDIGDIAGLAVAEMDAVVDLLHGHRAVGRSSPAKQRFFSRSGR